MAKKVYAVRKGRKTGIFDTWDECKAQVDGYSGPEYKSFHSLSEAKAFLQGGVPSGLSNPSDELQKEIPAAGMSLEELLAQPDTAVAYVDGSYESASGDFSYGVVFFYEQEEKHFKERFTDSALALMHNVAGEIKGSEKAMRYALERGVKKIYIFHDYEGIAKWCNGAWKANKEGTKAYRDYYLSICDQLEIVFVKVKGHSNDTYNDLADHLAKEALRESGLRQEK